MLSRVLSNTMNCAGSCGEGLLSYGIASVGLEYKGLEIV